MAPATFGNAPNESTARWLVERIRMRKGVRITTDKRPCRGLKPSKSVGIVHGQSLHVNRSPGSFARGHRRLQQRRHDCAAEPAPLTAPQTA